jgi:N-acetylglucosaminyl-diphospho-decaprenol L-rhamnosyltransferase
LTVEPIGAGRPAAGLVAAVVVNFEAGDLLSECVATLLTEGVAEVVVVDNGSADGSVARLVDRIPDVVTLAPGRNLGYGAGANRGMAATTAPYVLICNPDLAFDPGVVAALVEALESDPGAAIAGPLVRTSEGDRYPSARQFPSLVDAAGHAVLGLFLPSNPFTRAYQRTDLASAGLAVTPVDWVSGACFLARRAAFEGIGGFDEAYFMYAEEVDLCWRIGRSGWRVLYVPSAAVTHLQGASTAGHPYRMILEHHRSLLRFAGRSTTGWRRALLPLVAVGLALRTLLAIGKALATP